MCELFDVWPSDSSPMHVFCKQHYQAVYRHLHPKVFKKTRQCKTCKRYTQKLRPCPHPEVVQDFLTQNTHFEEEIGPDDRVCYSCYRSHLVLVKQIQHHPTCTSNDSDLRQVIIDVKKGLKDLTEVVTYDDIFNHMAGRMGVVVGEELLKHHAVLLPAMYEQFIHKVTHFSKLQNVHAAGKQAPTQQWLRNQLSSMLDYHMAYTCCIKKYGTVLYRYGGNLMHALNTALGQLWKSGSTKHTEEPAGGEQPSPDEDLLTQVCRILNGKMHGRLIEQESAEPYNISIDKFVDECDPDLWHAISILTEPKARMVGSTKVHVRKIRQFFCICALLFCTNSQCSFSLHTLLTDIIVSQGGTTHLIKMLNRLGVCASVETHARYTNYIAKQLEEEGVMAAYPHNTFTVLSADNLDIGLPYARIHCGKQQSSWHGTTIQAVQPQPKGLIAALPTPPRSMVQSFMTISRSDTCPLLPPLVSEPMSKSAIIPSAPLIGQKFLHSNPLTPQWT